MENPTQIESVKACRTCIHVLNCHLIERYGITLESCCGGWKGKIKAANDLEDLRRENETLKKAVEAG